MEQNTFRIQMMGKFTIYMNDLEQISLVSKTPKGCMLIQYLILSRGESVPNYRILSSLWPEDESVNPESALKTLVSRLRFQLNAVSPNLGDCLVSTRGGYRWICQPGMDVDLYQLEETFESLSDFREEDRLSTDPDEYRRLCRRMMSLYRGDLLSEHAELPWVMSRSAELHNQYMEYLYLCIELLKKKEMYHDIATLCRSGLEVDEFDDRLHIELMNALIRTGSTSKALMQYKHAVNLNYRGLGVSPSESIQEFYKQIVRADKTLDFNLEFIRNELKKCDTDKGAYVCEYAVFKEIYHLQMRNLERLGSTMFLAIIKVGREDEPMNAIQQNNICNDLLEILRYNLHRGDTITHFSPTVFALLLPMVNYTTGNMVMERIKQLFFQRYPNSNIAYSYKITPLSSEKKKV